MMACSREVAERQLARDGFPAPSLSKGRPVIAPYVGDGNVVCYGVADAKLAHKEVVSELVSRGFALRDLVEFDEDLDMVGCVLCGAHRRSRFWRLYCGVGQLLARGGCAGDVMRVVLGHLGNFFLLSRCCLSILQQCYQFVQENIGRYQRFNSTVVAELRTRQGALPLVVARLSDPFYEKAFISDSSTHGCALHQGYFSGVELRAIGRWRERWCFAEVEEAFGLGLEANGPRLDANFDCLGESFNLGEASGSGSRRPAAEGPVGARPRSGKAEVIGIAPALPDELLDSARWPRVLVGAWDRREAIYMKKRCVSLAGLRHAVADPRAHGCQVLSVGDNLSEIMATEEGRAVDHCLNALCRRAAALQLGAEIRWVRRCVESERNPTDADSRLADTGILKAGEALRPGRLAGRLRARAVGQAGGRGPSVAQNASQARSTGSEDSNEVARGLALALFSGRVLRVCRQCGATVSVENLATSGIWAYGPLKKELQKSSCSPVRYDACRYGAPFKKLTIFNTSVVSLGALDRRCSCRVPHEILEGKVRVEGPDGHAMCGSSGERRRQAIAALARADVHRAADHRGPSGIQLGGPKLGTLRVHTEAVKLFYLACKSAMMLVATHQELDVAMEQYLHKLYFDGETISRPNSTVHGLMYELNLTWSKTSEFPLTRKALQGYRKSLRDVSRDGAPRECAILTSGSRRPSLWVGIRELGKPTMAGAYDDTVLVGETAPERRPVLRAILAQIPRATKPGERLFPDLAAAKCELIFRRACQALGFGDPKLRPRSLQRGGASVDALNGVDTLAIQKRGRWNVIASCRRCEKKGRILRQLAILGQTRVQESADELARLVSKPPQLLFSALTDRKATGDPGGCGKLLAHERCDIILRDVSPLAYFTIHL
ncbi:unnamed protein product [Prorocentrum cordatum]|uniref:DNA-directed DNA polymerase n=1 Tax=Prorocentrum cordatum TaxID=2364126 RepID=A0ABN9T490_9DINO|nr:unnamed protein product [Polarella glacialis]